MVYLWLVKHHVWGDSVDVCIVLQRRKGTWRAWSRGWKSTCSSPPCSWFPPRRPRPYRPQGRPYFRQTSFLWFLSQKTFIICFLLFSDFSWCKQKVLNAESYNWVKVKPCAFFSRFICQTVSLLMKANKTHTIYDLNCRLILISWPIIIIYHEPSFPVKT